MAKLTRPDDLAGTVYRKIFVPPVVTRGDEVLTGRSNSELLLYLCSRESVVPPPKVIGCIYITPVTNFCKGPNLKKLCQVNEKDTLPKIA